MEVGKRLIYDKLTGSILNYTLDEMRGDLMNYLELRPEKIDYIDLPYNYNENNFKEAATFHIDITKNKKTHSLSDMIVIDTYIEKVLSLEEQKIQELENQLLIAENEKIGGIL